MKYYTATENIDFSLYLLTLYSPFPTLVIISPHITGGKNLCCVTLSGWRHPHTTRGSMLQDRRPEGGAPSSSSWDPWGELEAILLSLMLFSALFPFL